jgi:preprotein translocase subunit SecG
MMVFLLLLLMLLIYCLHVAVLLQQQQPDQSVEVSKCTDNTQTDAFRTWTFSSNASAMTCTTLIDSHRQHQLVLLLLAKLPMLSSNSSDHQ